MSLGTNIRRLRKGKGWTQGQLSERSGIKVPHISLLEQDDVDPKLATLYKLINASGCSPDSLLMDPARVNADAVLKQILERATPPPEVYKRIIIDVADKYCIACSTELAFRQGREAKCAGRASAASAQCAPYIGLGEALNERC
jgi:transcriptional regulator with XRE-family HTH domain